jgi:hypothetical protein
MLQVTTPVTAEHSKKCYSKGGKFLWEIKKCYFCGDEKMNVGLQFLRNTNIALPSIT